MLAGVLDAVSAMVVPKAFVLSLAALVTPFPVNSSLACRWMGWMIVA